MDGLPSSTAHTLSKELHTVKPYITILVLVTGVVGGLVIVISVILFCKYCIKHNKILRRQPAIFSRSLSTAGHGRRKYQVYESLDLTATSDVCASSQDFKSRNLYSDCSDDALRHDGDEENNIDYAVRKYKESLHVQDEVISRSSTTEHDCRELGLAELPQTEAKSADYRGFLQPPVTSDAAGRRVSFLFVRRASQTEYKNTTRRFTDGDFQNLKLLRMDRPQRMIKQKTYSGPSLDQAGRDQRRQSVASLRRAFTEVQNKELLPATESDVYAETSSSPRAALKLSGFLDSSSMPPRGGVALTKGVFKDSPPMALKPYRTEVSVEVHREAGTVGSGQQKEMAKVSLSHRASPPHSYSTVSSSSSRLSGRDKSWDRDRDRERDRDRDRERDRDRDRDRGLQRPRVESPQRLLAKPTRHAHSLEMVSPTDRLSIKYDQRRVKSYDGELLDNTRNHRKHDPGDYDRLEITQFNQGPFYNADYDVMCEGRSPEPQSKVRYNDTGSFEEITDEDVQLLDDLDPMDESDDTETLNGTQKYRELWTLRATFEEEEDFSDTIRMEDMTSPEEQSAEEQEPVLTSVTTSFESSTDPAAEPVLTHHHHQHYRRLSGHALTEHDVKPGSANLLHPNYESRRETYRSILSKRLKRIEAPNSTDNSFDSVETLDTDGDVSDTSRPEQTTTSFESTTDNTDSTGERETHRLQQMRGDSGYKSLETQQTLPQPLSPKRLTVAGGSTDQQDPQEDKYLRMPNPSPEDLQQVTGGTGANYGRECANISIPVPQTMPQQTIVSRRGTHLDRRSVRTASKKRREYSRERQAVHVSESAVGEAETDSRSDHMSGDSFDDSHVRSGKFSVFSRFFRSQCHKRGAVARDYSIDEKTNAIFHEFVRHDPYLDTTRAGGCTGFLLASGSRGAHPYTRHRSLHHRKSTDPTLGTDHRRRNKLTPEMRSVSLGSDSSTSSVRRLSPQDSIEEEDYEQLSPIIREQIQFSRLWSECKLADHRVSGSGGGQNGSDRWSLETSAHSSSTIKEIPTIKLPEDDSETPH